MPRSSIFNTSNIHQSGGKYVARCCSCAYAGLLTACASAPEARLVSQVQIVRLTPPAALLDCPAAPEVPLGQTQRDVALYVVRLASAGEACRRALDEVKAWSATGR